MKNIIFLFIVLVLVACSQNSDTDAIFANAENHDSLLTPELEKAKASLSTCTSRDVKIWDFKDSTFDGHQGVSIPLDDSLTMGNFSVEFDFVADSVFVDGGLASSGVLGEGSGWILRLEDGKVALLIREQGSKSWFKIFAGKSLNEEHNEVRLDRVESLLALTINGEMVFAVETDVNFSKMKGNLTIGYSAEKGADTSFFRGHFGKFCYRHIFKHHHHNEKNNTKDSSQSDVKDSSPSDVKDSSQSDVKDSSQSDVVIDSTLTVELDSNWIVDLEFNDSLNAGRDFSGNGHHATAIEGHVSIDSGLAYFDGTSGLRIDDGPDIKLGDFFIEARVYPEDVDGFRNILVTEPPGFGPDGWIFRFEDGELVFLVRDEEWGMDWEGVSVANAETGKWYDIRVECSSEKVRLFVDGVLKAEKEISGNYDNLQYKWGVGFDAVNQSIHNRYFKGYMDYIRIGRLQKGKEDAAGDEVIVNPDENLSLCDEKGLKKDENTLFFDEMDTVLYEGTLVDGVCGRAVSFEAGELVKTSIVLEDTIMVGTVEFWFRPGEDFYDEPDRTLLGTDESRVHFFIQNGDLIFQKNHADLHYFARGPVELSDGWNLIAGQWGDGYLSVYVNGTLVAKVEHNEPYVPSLRDVTDPNLIVAGLKSYCCMEALQQYEAMESSGTVDQVRVSNVLRY